jgi:hypothetical protein
MRAKVRIIITSKRTHHSTCAPASAPATLAAALLRLAIMDEEGLFEGIIGYSEGATIGTTLLLTELQRYEEEGRLPMSKCAVFAGGRQ